LYGGNFYSSHWIHACIAGLSFAIRIVSYHTVQGLPYVGLLYCIARSSYRVLSYRIKIPYHGSCSDRNLIFPRFYHDFSQAVLYQTYGRICGRHDTILGAWSVPIRIVMLRSDTYWTCCSYFFPRWSPRGHIWSLIGPKFGRNVDGA
jgi:hypothetical protein